MWQLETKKVYQEFRREIKQIADRIRGKTLKEMLKIKKKCKTG